MNTEIPHLKIERLENGCIRLENESAGDSYVVDVHPLHLRYMAEQLGLIREVSASDAEIIRTLRGQLADSERTVTRLARRMRLLQQRTAFIQNWLCTQSDNEHADLSYEMDYTTATMQICDEFCEELDDMLQRSGNASTVTELTPGNAKTDGLPVGNPAETQPVSKACANPSGKASAKASVKPSASGSGSLFRGDHG